MAKILPKVYYGLHFYPGVAEYRQDGKTAYRIFLSEDTIKNMSPTFQGLPVYVQHVEEVNLYNLQQEADGYVMESFFNKVDGKHWVKFIAVSDKAHEAISLGWKLSNAYIPKSFSGGGLCNGVEYDKEVLSAEYEHLAIVKTPRYEESVILTPEQFKQYNLKKELEIEKLKNSKGEKMLSFFKRSKVENSLDLESTMVVLPKSKKEITIFSLVEEMDKILNMQGYANNEHLVKVDNEEFSVSDLVEKFKEIKSELDQIKKLEEEDQKQNKEEEDQKQNKEEEPKEEEKKENEEEEKKKNKEEDPKEEKKQNNFNKLKNAHMNKKEKVLELSHEKLARGKARYGSN